MRWAHVRRAALTGPYPVREGAFGAGCPRRVAPVGAASYRPLHRAFSGTSPTCITARTGALPHLSCRGEAPVACPTPTDGGHGRRPAAGGPAWRGHLIFDPHPLFPKRGPKSHLRWGQTRACRRAAGGPTDQRTPWSSCLPSVLTPRRVAPLCTMPCGGGVRRSAAKNFISHPPGTWTSRR